MKLFFLLICLCLFISGCNKDGESSDITKIVSPTDHEVVKSYHSSRGEDLLNLAIINLRAGEIQKSIALLEKFTAYYPSNPVGQFYFGKAYYKNRMYEDSIKKFKKAFILDPASPEPLLYLGRAYEKTGNRKKAIKTLYEYLLRESDAYAIQKTGKEINSLAQPVVGKNIIGRISVTDEIIREKSLALSSKILFKRDTPEIFTSLEVIEAAYDTKIDVKWYYLVSNDKKMKVNSSSFKVEGSKNALVSIKNPSSDWPAGKYKLEIFVDNEKNTSLNFYIF